MGAKIKTTTIDGEIRVPPEVMDLLSRFAQHRDLCSQCERAVKIPHPDTDGYCATGAALMQELFENPFVEFVPD